MLHVTFYSSAIVNKVIKDVTCEKCGARFVYEMIRRATGSGTAVYGIGGKGAAENATHGASQAIQKILVQGEDLVACPNCNHFQQSMLVANAPRYWYWSPWGVGNRINPNLSNPPIRGSFPGTPTAVLVTKADRQVSPAFFQRPPDIEPGNILSIRMYQGEFPPICCICSNEATTDVDLEPKGGINPAITLPACNECVKKRRQSRWKRTIFAFAASVITLSTLFTGLMFLDEDSGDRFPMILGGVAAATLAGLILAVFVHNAKQRGLPVEVVRMDWETLICRMRFLDDTYRNRVQTHIATLPVSPNLLAYIAAQ